MSTFEVGAALLAVWWIAFLGWLAFMAYLLTGK